MAARRRDVHGARHRAGASRGAADRGAHAGGGSERHLRRSFPDPERDPLWAGFIKNRAAIRDGIIEVPQGPGFGLELDWQQIEKTASTVSTFPNGQRKSMLCSEV